MECVMAADDESTWPSGAPIWCGALRASTSPWAWGVSIAIALLFAVSLLSTLPPELRSNAILGTVVVLSAAVSSSILIGRYLNRTHAIATYLFDGALLIVGNRDKRVWLSMPVQANTKIRVKKRGSVIVIGEVDFLAYWMFATRPGLAFRLYRSCVVLRGLERPDEFIAHLKRMKDAETGT